MRECAEELGVAIVPQAFLGEVVLDGVVAGGAPGASTLRRVVGADRRRGSRSRTSTPQLRWLRADELDDLDWIAADRPLLPAVRALLAHP